MIDRRPWASAAEAGFFFWPFAVRLEVVPFPGVALRGFGDSRRRGSGVTKGHAIDMGLRCGLPRFP